MQMQKKVDESIQLKNFEKTQFYYSALGGALQKFTNSTLSAIESLELKATANATMYVASQYALQRSRDQVAELHSK